VKLNRKVRWRPLAGSGLELLSIRQWSDAIRVRAALIGLPGENDHGYFYDIKLGLDWTFHSISIERTDGARLALSSDTCGNWQADGLPRPDLSGCIDIDLSGSPFTNTLPIRRAHLPPGEPQRFDMAWIDLATLTIHRDGQVYTRLDERRFRYDGVDSGFTAEITVDEDGLVVSYPPLFEQA
jgi:hypothetical protein